MEKNIQMLIAVQFQSKGFNYGFVEYDDPGAAERAMQTLNGRRVHQAVGITILKTIQMANSVVGNPCQLGLPVQHLQQGRYV
jgi:hypothetical protein